MKLENRLENFVLVCGNGSTMQILEKVHMGMNGNTLSMKIVIDINHNQKKQSQALEKEE